MCVVVDDTVSSSLATDTTTSTTSLKFGGVGGVHGTHTVASSSSSSELVNTALASKGFRVTLGLGSDDDDDSDEVKAGGLLVLSGDDFLRNFNLGIISFNCLKILAPRFG